MKRELFDKLTQWKTAATRKPLLLYGARQIGKTYLLKEFGQKSFERCHYFNFEEDRSLHTPFKQHLTPQRIIEDFKILGYNINLERDLIIF